ncbi:hypothetical protein PROFUN_00162 [Planoprotostelium fungivorum]|uniref:Uncharacterized protein n=1 Tax=Planoprotostelium fungivorum TaxID=1890364 RepID=A0A2P6P0V4_9EUKA|nr:hypothetical protein PROFUN_00162 [Planoprotostelium fungivorum]
MYLSSTVYRSFVGEEARKWYCLGDLHTSISMSNSGDTCKDLTISGPELVAWSINLVAYSSLLVLICFVQFYRNKSDRIIGIFLICLSVAVVAATSLYLMIGAKLITHLSRATIFTIVHAAFSIFSYLVCNSYFSLWIHYFQRLFYPSGKELPRWLLASNFSITFLGIFGQIPLTIIDFLRYDENCVYNNTPIKGIYEKSMIWINDAGFLLCVIWFISSSFIIWGRLRHVSITYSPKPSLTRIQRTYRNTSLRILFRRSALPNVIIFFAMLCNAVTLALSLNDATRAMLTGVLLVVRQLLLEWLPMMLMARVCWIFSRDVSRESHAHEALLHSDWNDT